MKYNAFLVLGCLILLGCGCQFVRRPPPATKMGSPLALPPAETVKRLRLPPLDVPTSISRARGSQRPARRPVVPVGATSERNGPVRPANHDPLPRTWASFDTLPTLWDKTKADTFGLWQDVRDDHENFYTWKNTKTTTGMFAIAAILAHSDADREFRNAWQEDVRSNSWDNLSSIAHEWGDAKYLIAASCAAVGFEQLMSHTPTGDRVGEWGHRSARSLLVGFPPLLILQRVTGASRPLESSTGSIWVLFGDENGVSGHTFVGAVPFICAAQMTENRLAVVSLYTCSTLTGISRINQDAHYLSQVMLGWWLAHMACTSTDETQVSRQIHFAPIPTAGGLGIGVHWQH